ncbi:MAG: adenylate/guanylate cyclase domain-containing protein, partial [Oligoflexales bacterium]|nr:adenylate/guanylate cyclase domain-containing protein [Oligoflexales bacterium]
FTKRSEDVGPLAISRILNNFFDRMTKIIYKFEGTVDKFIGDAIMVIFGAPKAINTKIQVRNALLCAIEMQKEIEKLNSEWHGQRIGNFKMRIGLHKGSGIVGSFGGELRSEYTVIGPVVNMASRIEKSASPGEIFFSPSIRDSVGNTGWTKVGKFDLRGIGEVMLFKVDSDAFEKEDGNLNNPDKENVA